MSEIEIHVLDHKVRLLQAENGFRTSLDSVFLASACMAGAGDHILDMGCGVGGASFCLLWRVPQTYLTGVDIQQSHVDLARRNIALNKMESRAEFICADITQFKSEKSFDHIICNPPYLEAGSYTPSPKEERAIALGHTPPFILPQAGGDDHGLDPGERGGKNISLQNWLDAGFHNLKSGGSLTMIHRADVIDKIIQGLGRRFGALEIIPLYPRVGQEARRVIIRAIKDRKTPARLREGIILHETDGTYTAKADAILRDGAPIG